MNLFRIFTADSSVAADVTSVADSSGASGGGGGLSSMLPTILMLVGIVAVFYFLMIRPEKKRKKQAQEQRDSLKVGDTVISIGGITGEIESIRTNTVTIFTGDCSMDLQKWAIRSVVTEADEAEGDKQEDKKEDAE